MQGGAHEIGRGQVIFKPILSLGPGSETTFRIHATADHSGDHVFRAEVTCASLNTKLAGEETTHFYGDDTDAEEGAAPAEIGQTKARQLHGSGRE